jgi:hypothetical protein
MRRLSQTQERKQKRKRRRRKKEMFVEFSFFCISTSHRKMIVKIDPKMDLLQMIMMLKKDESIVMALV